MTARASIAPILAFYLAGTVTARPPVADTGRTTEVPYRLTDTYHMLVRAKLNGKGPFNFILDTGAPAMFVAEPVARQLGIRADDYGWGMVDRVELEGGVVIPKARVRVETPFQLEGINGLGLAGAPIHGMIGYNILARYRLDFDFSRDTIRFTRLNYDPPQPHSLAEKGGGPAGLNALGGAMKFVGALLGRNAEQMTPLRGFAGLNTEDRDGTVVIIGVLPNSPAERAGLQVGDGLSRINSQPVPSAAEGRKQFSHRRPGESIRVELLRRGQTLTVTITLATGV